MFLSKVVFWLVMTIRIPAFAGMTNAGMTKMGQEVIMPVITVDMWEGRTLEQKKKLVKGLTDAFVNIGTPAEAVHIILNDHPKNCWGQNGKLASEP
jgi:4-oxalocrotonate tautomerase